MKVLNNNHLRRIALEVILNDVKSISYDGRKIRKFAQTVPASFFAEIIDSVSHRLITRFSLYTILSLCNKNRNPDRILKSILDEHNLHAINDGEELERLCLDVIKENPKQLERYKNNPKKSLEQLQMALCKKYHGRIHEDLVINIFKRVLEKQ